MAANAMVIYAANKDDIAPINLVGAVLKMALYTSTLSPNVTFTGDSVYSATNELATANGYTQGGVTLTGVVAATAGNDGVKLSSGNAVWTASGGSIPAFRYAVLYTTATINSVANRLVGYILCDNTPADIPATTTGNTLTITCPSPGGWFDVI